MTRLWLPFGRRMLVLLVLLASLLVLLPLRVAIAALDLDSQGVAARRVTGSVWAGRIEQLRVSDIPLGDVRVHLAPLDLLIGRARLQIARAAASGGAPGPGGAALALSESDAPLSGALLVSRTTLGVADLTARLPLGAALAPLPVGAASVTNLSVRFAAGACRDARGTVQVMLTDSLAGIAATEGLRGAATCDGRYLRLALASQSGRERLDLRIAVTGDYIADLIAVEPDPERAATLAGAGFAAVPGGYRLRATGRFR